MNKSNASNYACHCTDGLQAIATEPLSRKKNAVAANIPIEIIQNEIPTKSSGANKIVSAFAVFDIPIRAKKIKVNILSVYIFKIFFGCF